MKKIKVLFILFFILCINIIPFDYVNAHSVDLDPEKLISFPWLISNGEGTISIDDSQTGYSLYYQAVEIPNADYVKMEEIKNNGKIALDTIKSELEKLDAECDNLKTTYDEAFEAWEAKVESGASDEEIESAKTAYETAKTNYQNKVKEYNNKVAEYNAKSEEINNKVKALVPTYLENNWLKTEDGKFSVDLSQFSGDKAFAVWAKLVSSNGTISYDEATYTMSGTKVDKVSVKSISLDKTSLNIIKGSNYTLVATIQPADATNKLVIWTSDNEDVAKVEDGKVSAISEGTATITATSEDGKHMATCKVTVIKKDTNSSQDNKNPDSTVANGKLPQTGSLTYIIVSFILILSVIVVIIYKKVKYLNFK